MIIHNQNIQNILDKEDNKISPDITPEKLLRIFNELKEVADSQGMEWEALLNSLTKESIYKCNILSEIQSVCEMVSKVNEHSGDWDLQYASIMDFGMELMKDRVSILSSYIKNLYDNY